MQVLLNGDGADELLAIPKYATAQIGRQAGVWAARRYLADARRGSSGGAGETLALVADRLPPRMRSRLYWAATWPAWCRPSISAVVREPWRTKALSWAQEWIGGQLDQHVQRRHRWAEADAADALWSRAYLPASGPVPEASPFLGGMWWRPG